MGAALMKPMFDEMKEFMNYQNYGGSVMLGTRKVVVKGHGSGDGTAVAKCIEQAREMRKTILDQSFDGEFFVDNALRENGEFIKTDNITETCQYYAFYFGTATPETYPALWEKMRTVFGPGRDAEKIYPTVYPSNAIVGNYLRLELLLENGYHSQVLQECKDFFSQMAALTGTLWEHSRLSSSLNHGFASIAALYIDQCTK